MYLVHEKEVQLRFKILSSQTSLQPSKTFLVFLEFGNIQDTIQAYAWPVFYESVFFAGPVFRMLPNFQLLAPQLIEAVHHCVHDWEEEEQEVDPDEVWNVE